MNDHLASNLLEILEQINTNLARLVKIQHQRLEIELSMTADTVKQLVDAITSLIQADVNDKNALKTAQDALDAMTAQDASLNDPALQASVDAALAAAAAAGPATGPATGGGATGGGATGGGTPAPSPTTPPSPAPTTPPATTGAP